MTVLLIVATFSDPIKAMSGQLVPFSGYSFVEMMNSELGLHRELASSDLNQLESMEEPNFVSGLHSSSCSIYALILSPTATYHPLLPPVILLLACT